MHQTIVRGSLDAHRLSHLDVPVTQINTGTSRP